MLQLTFFNGTIIFIIMFVCCFIGASTGGSALLTIPFCIIFGFSPQVAVATTRVGLLGSTIANWYGFSRKGKINYKVAIIGSGFSAAGAIFGAHTMLIISPDLLQRIIGILMIITLLITFGKKTFGKTNQQICTSKISRILGYSCLFGIGFISGMFGGQGVIMNFILTLLFSQSLLEAAGTRSIINFVVALVAVVIYQAHSSIDWPFAIVIISSMTLGSLFGSMYSIKKGEKWAEKLFHIVAALMSIKLII